MSQSFVVQVAKNSSVYPTSPINVGLKDTTAGNALYIVVEGAKILSPYTVSSLTTNTAAPVVKDNKGNTYTVTESQVNFDGDLGYYGSIYVYEATNVASGINNITVTALDSAGRPTFNHGLNVQVIELAHIVATNAVDGHKGAKTAANPAVAGAITTTAAGDVVLAAAYFRRASEFTAPAGWTMVDEGQVIGTPNDYYAVMYREQDTTVTMQVTGVALTSNVATLDVVNTFTGNETGVVIAGLTHTAFNGTRTLTAATANTVSFALTAADVAHTADTGTATYVASGAAIDPGFNNPMYNGAGIVTLALKQLVS